jgi:hypothetical protein
MDLYFNSEMILLFALTGYLANVSWKEGTCYGKWLSNSFIERASYKPLSAIIERVRNIEKLFLTHFFVKYFNNAIIFMINDVHRLENSEPEPKLKSHRA